MTGVIGEKEVSEALKHVRTIMGHIIVITHTVLVHPTLVTGINR